MACNQLTKSQSFWLARKEKGSLWFINTWFIMADTEKYCCLCWMLLIWQVAVNGHLCSVDPRCFLHTSHRQFSVSLNLQSSQALSWAFIFLHLFLTLMKRKFTYSTIFLSQEGFSPRENQQWEKVWPSLVPVSRGCMQTLWIMHEKSSWQNRPRVFIYLRHLNLPRGRRDSDNMKDEKQTVQPFQRKKKINPVCTKHCFG